MAASGLLELPSEDILLDELSGCRERGCRPPPARLPGKSYLGNVLLSSNPSEQRDLNRRLDKIRSEKMRREKTLEWNQRHFFVKQVFDQELNLRFTKEREYVDGSPRQVRPGQSARGTPRQQSPRGQETSRSGVLKQGGVGQADNVCRPVTQGAVRKPAPPGPTGRPATQGAPQRPTIPRIEVTGPESSLPSLSSARSTVGTRGHQPRRERSDQPSLPDLSASDPNLAGGHRLMSQTQLVRHFTSPADLSQAGKDEAEPQRLSKSISLPHLSKKPAPVIFASPCITNRTSRCYHLAKSNASGQALCEDDVICRITNTLPTSLMIRANKSINTVIEAKKLELLKLCQQERTRDAFEDPRWTNLAGSLLQRHEGKARDRYLKSAKTNRQNFSGRQQAPAYTSYHRESILSLRM